MSPCTLFLTKLCLSTHYLILHCVSPNTISCILYLTAFHLIHHSVSANFILYLIVFYHTLFFSTLCLNTLSHMILFHYTLYHTILYLTINSLIPQSVLPHTISYHTLSQHTLSHITLCLNTLFLTTLCLSTHYLIPHSVSPHTISYQLSPIKQLLAPHHPTPALTPPPQNCAKIWWNIVSPSNLPLVMFMLGSIIIPWLGPAACMARKA